jgi:hypothetical protein
MYRTGKSPPALKTLMKREECQGMTFSRAVTTSKINQALAPEILWQRDVDQTELLTLLLAALTNV